MFARMQARGQKIEVRLYMEAHIAKQPGTSHNLIGEITGSKYPNEVILMGGHIDSWDTGPQTAQRPRRLGRRHSSNPRRRR